MSKCYGRKEEKITEWEIINKEGNVGSISRWLWIEPWKIRIIFPGESSNVNNLANAILGNRTYTNTNVSKSRYCSTKKASNISIWQIPGWMGEASGVPHWREIWVRLKRAFHIILWHFNSTLLNNQRFEKEWSTPNRKL